MNIEVGREQILRALGRAQGVVDRRQPMAILTNLLLEAGNGLSVIATDLEVSLKQNCEANVSEGGQVAVSARKLFEIVRESSSDVISLKSLDNRGLEVSYGRSNFKLLGIDPADHPGMPKADDGSGEGTDIQVSAEDLAEMIRKTLFAVSSDDTRSNLAGVFLNSGDDGARLRMVATDGHRLAVIERAAGGGPVQEGVILPRKGLAELAKLLQDQEGLVRLSVSGSEAVIEVGDCLLGMRLVEGAYPDYHQVLPDETPKQVQTGRDDLLQSLRRVSILSSERVRGVRVALTPGQVRISANNPDIGEAFEDLEAGYEGEELEVGFNARYVIEMLTVLPEGSNVTLGFNDQLSPCMVTGDDAGYRYVVMPMRI